MNFKRLCYAILAVIIMALIGWITYSQTLTIDKLRSQGKDYNVGAVTVENGKNGKSTYELAVDNGFQGSLTDWLISLATQPIKGDDGKPGPSAYDLAVNYGFQGSVVDWLLSLRGPKGDTAPAITSDQLYGSWVSYCSISICQGSPGKDGVNGTNGTNGTNGDNITRACVLRNGSATDSNAPGVTTTWIAFKYSHQPDSAYQDVYTQPTGSVCASVVDLTAL